MSTGGDSSDTAAVLRCEAEEWQRDHPYQRFNVVGEIRLEFGDVAPDFVGDPGVETCLRLRVAELDYCGWGTYYVRDVAHFADRVATLHRDLSGSAWLHDWDSEPITCLTMLDRRTGRIAVGLRIVQAIFWTDTASAAAFYQPRLPLNAAGVKIDVEGLVTNQSDLPRFLSGIRRFLNSVE